MKEQTRRALPASPSRRVSPNSLLQLNSELLQSCICTDTKPALARRYFTVSSLSDLDFLNSLPASSTSSTSPTAPAAAVAAPPSLPSDSPLAPLFASLSASLDPSAPNSLANLSLSDNPDDLDEEAVKALLAQMEEADLAADGLEERLDGLLRSLDGMLGALGVEEGSDEDEEEQGEEKVEKDEVTKVEEKMQDQSAEAEQEEP